MPYPRCAPVGEWVEPDPFDVDRGIRTISSHEQRAFLARLHLDLMGQHTRVIEDHTAPVEMMVEPFRAARPQSAYPVHRSQR